MKKQTSKKISLVEFKAWLSGIEELQPNDWSPTPEQWKLIRKKIKSIVDDVQTNQPTSQDVNHRVVRRPSSLPIPPPPMPPAGVPSGAPVVTSPAAATLLEGPLPGSEFA